MLGAAVRIGLRQSMPSSSIESCARLNETTPLSACGQTKRPRSRRLANRHSPSPSHHSTFTRSPRLPRKTNTCPEYGFCSSTVCTAALKPVKPRRMSVMPAEIQMLVLDGSEITGSVAPEPYGGSPDRPIPRPGCGLVRVRCGWRPKRREQWQAVPRGDIQGVNFLKFAPAVTQLPEPYH